MIHYSDLKTMDDLLEFLLLRGKNETARAMLRIISQHTVPACPGIPRKGCNYTATCNSVCNKCGEVHSSHALVVTGLFPYQPSTDRAATVSNEAFWIPIDEHTPRGTKMWLINKPAGSATQGQYSGPGSFFTHWFPLPRFRKDDDETQP